MKKGKEASLLNQYFKPTITVFVHVVFNVEGNMFQKKRPNSA